MKKHRRSLAAVAVETFRRFWQGPRQSRPGRGAKSPFGLELLEERLALTHSAGDHVHAELRIFLDGQEVIIPPNIGITTTNHFNPHTHDYTGTIHMGEGGPAGLGTDERLVTLDDFFDVWRTTNVGLPSNNPNALFDSTHLMNRTADASHTIRMYVNGVLNTQFEAYTPHDGDEIVLSYEPTSTPVGSPLLEPIANQTVLVGSPLFLALDGFDPQGQNLTYTVSSSNPNVIQPTILSGNRSMQITVANFGTMTFQLFDNFVPRVTNAIAGLANANFYDGLTFHRIIDGFMIQGGSHNGSGGANPNVADFDDQFHFDLQHNSSGLLSMAKNIDDTNDTQFFITDAAARHLDFNHSIFGKLTDGDEIRNAINSVPTNVGNQPLTPVTMTDMQLVTDNENGVLLLKAAPGATSGTSTITVTATDSEGKTFVRTFTATLAADTSNGAPFLSDIAPIQGAVNQPVQFQLPGNDVEGDAIAYSAVKVGGVNYSVSVSPSGLVTVTPPAGFVGSFQVLVGAKAASQQSIPDEDQVITDVQLVTVNIGTVAPTGIDLVAATDTGFSNTDNVTNASTLSFSVSGLAIGATVKIYDGNTVVAQGIAANATETFTINSASFSQGVHQFSATQTVSGESETAKSPALAVTFDTTPPAAITSAPPSEATVGTPLTYNAQHPEEGTTNFRYGLVSPPSGVNIDPATGVLTWTPTQAQIGAHTFAISATDAAGNAVTQAISITVAAPVPKLAEVAVSVVNTSGQPVTSLQLNQDFFLVVQIQDLRDNPQGAFSFVTDVTYNSNLATVTGAIQFGSQYNTVNTGSAATPGLLDEVGGVSGSFTPIGGGFKELFRVPMKATAAGQLTFTADPADSVDSEILLFELDDLLQPNQITFGSTNVNVALNFTANNDTATFSEDSSNNTINVLNNDTIQSGSGAVLTVTAVGATSNGGTVTIAPDGKSLRYTPAANFFGTETFTYTVQNQSGGSATASVTVTVTNVNDPPTAGNDTFTVLQNSSNNNLTVLSNDSASPDTNETLTITAVSAGSQQGTITIAPGGGSIRYSPKTNFTGTETFTYTISDGHGGTRQATVTMTVNAPGPVATNDTATVQEDSSATTINVLANDVPEPGGSQNLSVQSVGAASNGGTVTLGASGANVIYTPAANFQGTETFTYTLTDGTKTSTATVTVTVTNTNDPPTATNDTLDAFKNTATPLNVLANDVSTPDPAETFTITAVTQGAHGTVTISQDGTRAIYTPATDYTGPDTFTYTMRDPGGLTSTATVNVTVQNFLPSTLGGKIFIDANDNGVFDAGERPIYAALVTLTGTDSTGAPVNLTTNSSADGAYSFANLAPGNYTIQQTQPMLLLDGKDSVNGLAGASIAANDKFSIALQQGTTANSLNFGELGKPRQFTRIQEFFASNLRNNLLASIPYTAPTTSNPSFPTPVAPAWQTSVGNQWNGFSEFKYAVSNNNQQLQIQAKNSQSQAVQATVPLADTSKVLDLGTQNGHRLFRLFGAPATFNFQPVQQQAQAEGEADDSIDAALAALFDPHDEQLLATLAASQEADEAAIDEALADDEEQVL